MKAYQQIAQSFQAYLNCVNSDQILKDKDGDTWESNHAARCENLVREHAPSGSGFDNGTQFDIDASKPDRLVFTTAFHHMNEHGYYDGWTEHQVIVTPSLVFGFDIRVTGRDRREIKEYIGECFEQFLNTDSPR